MALRHNVRALYHCTFADEEALDMLEAKRSGRDRVSAGVGHRAPTVSEVIADIVVAQLG